jgi:hypothetical protein
MRQRRVLAVDSVEAKIRGSFGDVSASFLFSGRKFYYWHNCCLKDMVTMACQFLPVRIGAE